MSNMPYIIAEIGINHNGDLDTALTLIRKAKEIGCNCVKFQKRDPDTCVPHAQKQHLRWWKGESIPYIEYKKDIEFWDKEYDVINAYCKAIGIDWTVSVWDFPSVEFMSYYKDDIPFIKVPSACANDEEIINGIKTLIGKPIIVSDGMFTTEEFLTEVYPKYEKTDLLEAVLHTNSTYPNENDSVDLNILNTYKNHFNCACNYGYSGHEVGYYPSLVAAALGSKYIERHITLDHNLEGTDHKASLEVCEFAKMIEEIKKIVNILGSYNKTLLYPGEDKIKEKLRK